MLAEMPNLHKLMIVLACPQIQFSDDPEGDKLVRQTFTSFLEALRDVHVHGIFDVYLPYSEDEKLNEAFFPGELLPFRLRQVPSHVLRFHEDQANEIPIEQAVRAFDSWGPYRVAGGLRSWNCALITVWRFLQTMARFECN
jgi:hypothetical protein